MEVADTIIPGVKIIEPTIFGDSRGFFYESYQLERYQQHGMNLPFIQDNVSSSQKGVLRGLHHQCRQMQGKLVSVMFGQVCDVIVDIRQDSPSFAQSVMVMLDADSRRQVYIPPGCAHGFYVVSEKAMFSYKCTDYYDPSAEISVRWDDPQLAIDWPLDGEPVLSDKDRQGQFLKDIPLSNLPRL